MPVLTCPQPARRARQVAALAAVALLAACGSPPPPGPQIRITEPADGAVLTSPFRLQFAVRGLVVAPAGEVIEGSGHHHLLINADPLPAGTAVPFSERHLHFGKGQTDTELSLPPGTYRLTAQFANGAHQSYGPALSHQITVTVK